MKVASSVLLVSLTMNVASFGMLSEKISLQKFYQKRASAFLKELRYDSIGKACPDDKLKTFLKKRIEKAGQGSDENLNLMSPIMSKLENLYEINIEARMHYLYAIKARENCDFSMLKILGCYTTHRHTVSFPTYRFFIPGGVEKDLTCVDDESFTNKWRETFCTQDSNKYLMQESKAYSQAILQAIND